MEAKQTIAHEMIELISPWPVACTDKYERAIRLNLAREMSNATYDQVIKFIEFQREMNDQQWDNLLRQLEMSRVSFVAALDMAEEEQDKPDTEAEAA